MALTDDALLALHKLTYAELDAEAGCLRFAAVTIQNSPHAPPPASLLPILLEEMCDYVNDNWDLRTPIHLSAYVLWRFLWIHPFLQGNGTIGRALAYLVLTVRWGALLPGTKTIPEQIAADRSRYYAALEAADRAWAAGKLDVSSLEDLIGAMLDVQLKST